MAPPCALGDIPLALDTSIGLALFPSDAEELDALLEKADQSMYTVKRTRKTHRA